MIIHDRRDQDHDLLEIITTKDMIAEIIDINNLIDMVQEVMMKDTITTITILALDKEEIINRLYRFKEGKKMLMTKALIIQVHSDKEDKSL